MVLELLNRCTPLQLVWMDFLERCESIVPPVRKRIFIDFVDLLVDYAPDALQYLDLNAVIVEEDQLTLLLETDDDTWHLRCESLRTRLKRSSKPWFCRVNLVSIASGKIFRWNAGLLVR